MYYRISFAYMYFIAVIVIVAIGLNILVPESISYSRESGSSIATGANVTSGTGTIFNNPINVSIVPGAATMGNKAFSPNPINIKVGDTITWTNNDDSSPPFHTVTSGLGF